VLRTGKALRSAGVTGVGAKPRRSTDFGAALRARIENLFHCDTGDTYVIARMSIWSRWILWAIALGYLLTRPDTSANGGTTLLVMIALLALANAGFHWRLVSRQAITSVWFLSFSAIDAAVIIAASGIESGFQPFVYLGLYPALASIAVAFSSFTLCMAWTTLVAAAYVGVVLSLGGGAGLEMPDTPALAARVLMMTAVTVAVNMVTGYERTGRLQALEREQALHRERIELSQRIHDTSAQSAYMIGLGIENAIALADENHGELKRMLGATAELSRSAMWELRQPIDMGLIYEGQELSQVLGAHARNFTTITSVPAELAQIGVEPRLEPLERARLLSIAHNALTNAHRHAQASLVKIELEFAPQTIRMSVSDDGIGLPEDYGERGHGFRNMRAEAERLNGELHVEPGVSGKGTTVTCRIPYHRT
jgi:signal transduction histidine kinase